MKTYHPSQHLKNISQRKEKKNHSMKLRTQPLNIQCSMLALASPHADFVCGILDGGGNQAIGAENLVKILLNV